MVATGQGGDEWFHGGAVDDDLDGDQGDCDILSGELGPDTFVLRTGIHRLDDPGRFVDFARRQLRPRRARAL